MSRWSRQADRSLATGECGYCQEGQTRLYRLPLVRPMGELSDLAVCLFCYIRLAGIKPRREAALAITD